MFTINIAKGIKHTTTVSKPKASRLCLGTVVKVNEVYQCKVYLHNTSNDEEFIIVPFTEESLNLKDKTMVYGTKKDKNNHWIEYHRDKLVAHIHPGLPTQYTTVVEGCVCSGHVIRQNGKLYFDMKNVHGIGKLLRDVPIIDESVPLFNNSNNEYNN